MQNFLDTIWGSGEGLRCYVTGKKFAHTFKTDNQYTAPRGQVDQWYAISLFSDKQRKIENVISSKAFYLDIDIKDGRPDCYPTLLAAMTALADFVEKLDLPTPTMIRSGNGLHCYWILDTPVAPAQWLKVARALQAACVDHGFLADGAITTDIARILRVPGTMNYKDETNPKPVTILSDVTTTTYERLETTLADFIFKVELREAANAENAKFATELPQTPKDANAIADACPQMSLLRSTRGDLPEPQWYAGLGVLALCLDGEAIAHEWSKGYAKYSADETSAKFDRAKEFAPTTCSKFYDTNPTVCQGCPFYGKVVTPVQLGETVTPLELVTDEIAPEGITNIVKVANEARLVPKPYDCGKEGVYMTVKGATPDDPPTRQHICKYPVWVTRVMRTENRADAEFEVTWIMPFGEQCSDTLDYKLMASTAIFEAELRRRRISGYGQIKQMIKYLDACIDFVAEREREGVIYDKFGFTEDKSGFVIGRDRITADGREPARISSRVDRRKVTQSGEAGTIEGWTAAMQLLDRPEFWPHRFAVLAILSTPLFALVGSQGSVLSLAGDSGSGKSTVADAGISAFGLPAAFMVSPESTFNFFYEQLRQAGNLPIVINEAATIRRDWMTKLILAMANGEPRGGLTQDRKTIDAGEWRTLSVLTSNTHIRELPNTQLTDAARNRIFELSFTKDNLMPLSVGRPLNAAILENYGIAGRMVIEYILKNRAKLTQTFIDRQVALEERVNNIHRHNIWLIAAASVAADISTELGIIKFQTDDCIKNALGTLFTHAHETKTPVERVAEEVAEWSSKYQRDIGTVSKGVWVEPPFGEARGRYNAPNGGAVSEFCLPTKQFNSHCLGLGIDNNHIKQYMASLGAKSASVRLSQNSGGIWCYILPWEPKS